MSTTPTPPALVYTREELAAALGMGLRTFEPPAGDRRDDADSDPVRRAEGPP